jgi:hypothetical protein
MRRTPWQIATHQKILGAGSTVEAKLQRLLAAGVIGPSSTDTRPVASGRIRPRPRRSASDLLGEQRR